MTDDEYYSVSEATRFSFDDTETIILNTASQREDGIVLPVPKSIKTKPEQVQRKLKRLLKAGVIEEVFAKLEDGLWRKDAEDRHLTLKLTANGRRTFDNIHFGDVAETERQEKGFRIPATGGASKPEARPAGRFERKKVNLLSNLALQAVSLRPHPVTLA